LQFFKARIDQQEYINGTITAEQNCVYLTQSACTKSVFPLNKIAYIWPNQSAQKVCLWKRRYNWLSQRFCTTSKT